MNMKKSFIGILAATIILSGCGTSQMAAGDPNAVLAGAAIGSNVGGAIGGLIGDSNGGWRGGYRGSAIGTIIGTIAGAAIANAATAPQKQEEYSYRIERTQPYPPQSGRQPQASAIDHLRIRNIRFIDDSLSLLCWTDCFIKGLFPINHLFGHASVNGDVFAIDEVVLVLT